MVKSGLSHRIDVSQYRLTAHLGLATLIYAYMVWVALGLWRGRAEIAAGEGLRKAAQALAGLVFFQMLLGGFVAGLKAGYIYNTWAAYQWRLHPAGSFSS